MSSAQVHLMTAHLPVLGVLFATVLAAVGLIVRSDVLFRTGLWTFLISTVSFALPYLSGPPLYDRLVSEYGIGKQAVEDHAVIARAAVIAAFVLSVIILSVLIRDLRGERPAVAVRWLLIAGMIAITYLGAWTADLGGLVRHPELQNPPLQLFPELPKPA